MTPAKEPRPALIRADRAGNNDAEVRFAHAVITFNETFLLYTDAAVALNGPVPGRRVQFHSAAQKADDALSQLQLAWTAGHHAAPHP